MEREQVTVKQHQQVIYELLIEFDRICKKYDIPYSLYAGTALGAIRHNGFIPWDDDGDVIMLREDYNRFMKIARQELKGEYFLQEEYTEHWPIGSSKLRKNNTTCLEKYHPKDNKVHQGIYIDIFPCDNASDSNFIRKIQFYSSRVTIAQDLFKRGYETDNIYKKIFMQVCRLLPSKIFRNIVLMSNKKNSRFVHGFYGSTRDYKKSVFPREWIHHTEAKKFEDTELMVSKHYDKLLTVLYGDYMKLPPEEERKIKVHALLVDVDKNYTEYLDYRDGMKFDVYTRSIR